MSGPDQAISNATALIDHALRACAAFDRPDLAAPLQLTRDKLSDPAIHVVVVGEFKQGKSSLVNGLVGTTVCPVDDDIATALPTYLRYGAETSASLLLRDRTPTPDATGEAALGIRREPIEMGQLATAVLERPAPTDARADGASVTGAEVRLSRPLLRGGVVLVDTPGVGGLGSAHAAASLAAAATANALVFVTDAAQELTRAELDFLRQARTMCDNVICALTKTDLYPSWHRIRTLTEGHLHAAGIDATVIPLATPLRLMALQADDATLNAESGYPDLIRALSERVGGDVARTVAQEACADVVAVCTQLEAQFGAERAALVDPEVAAKVVTELTAVQEQVQALKSAAARWNRTLTDGIGDLNADIDFDLRRRLRAVLTEATEAIDASDPADTWGEMEVWLEARVSHEVLGNFNLLRERATELSELVGEHFREASGEVLSRLAVLDPLTRVDDIAIVHDIDLERMTMRRKVATMMKSAYGGSIMFVMLGSMLGVTLGPIAVGIALVMGGKGLKAEKVRQREARQRQAGAALRQYVDEIGFVVGKDSRDSLRQVQRQLRDHYTELAEQLDRSNSEALRRAKEAVTSDEASRKRRLSDVDAELGRLKTLRERAAQEVGR